MTRERPHLALRPRYQQRRRWVFGPGKPRRPRDEVGAKLRAARRLQRRDLVVALDPEAEAVGGGGLEHELGARLPVPRARPAVAEPADAAPPAWRAPAARKRSV